MQTCFVIQPFDGGEFDNRYKDIYEPAIRKAGLEAYRVDEDKAVQIPIDSIEEKIKDSAICLADISLDNPNVMFELGYALALDKDVVLICKEDTRNKFPFDIRHRNIIKYKTGSPTDFVKLEKEIVESLKARIEKQEKIASTNIRLPVKHAETELTQQEEIALISIFENLSLSNDADGVPDGTIEKDIAKLGYNKVAKNFALMKLIKNQYVLAQSYYYENYEFVGYTLTEKGQDWLLSNESKLEFKTKADSTTQFEDVDPNDIPF